MKRLNLLILCFFLIQAGFAQRQLLLVSKNRILDKFLEGEKIRYKTKGARKYVTGTLTEIQLRFIRVDEDTVYLDRISRIDMRTHVLKVFHVSSSGAQLIVAGAMLVVFDALNQKQSYKASAGILLTAGVMMAVGITLQFVTNSHFKVGRKKRLLMGGS